MVDFIKIEGSPAERGYQQGEQLKNKIHNMFDIVFHSKMFSEVTSKLIPLSIIKLGLGIIGKRNIKNALKQLLPNQYEKIDNLSKASGISSRLLYGAHFIEVMSGNPKSLYKNPPVQECSMIFAVPDATSDNSMIFGRNYDFPNVLQPFQVVREEHPDNGFKNINFTQYPLIGSHMGLNEKGLAIGYNYGRSWKKEPLDFRLKGVPGTFIVQEVLETCATTQEAMDVIIKFPKRANGCHYGLIDTSGDICVIETTSTRHAIRRPLDGILAHTNHYQTEELKDANLPDYVRFKMDDMDINPIESPIRRYKREIELLKKSKGQISFETFKAILSDHDNREPDDFTVCTHGPAAGTLGSIIVLPTKKEFWVTDNHPCISAYEKFTLG
ncbi:MAG: linear amide C-N hydrolase [Promethearchaeota archaeon]|nr:MAG: linear amide C-N hydrolase [Candidatus Lokiarchaeota archaeon]